MAGDLRDRIHLLLDDVAHRLVVLVDGLTSLEVDVAVLGADLCDWRFGAHAAGAESGDCLAVDHLCNGLVGDFLELVNFVAGAEAVEELEEWNHRGICREVCDQRHVHLFLDGVCGEHGESGVAARHHVGVVAEDGEGLARQ